MGGLLFHHLYTDRISENWGEKKVMSLAFDHLLGEFIKPVRMAPLCSSPDMADMQMFPWKTCVY